MTKTRRRLSWKKNSKRIPRFCFALFGLTFSKVKRSNTTPPPSDANDTPGSVWGHVGVLVLVFLVRVFRTSTRVTHARTAALMKKDSS
jgi:hypothetical protein